jgi:hypothetical protein
MAVHAGELVVGTLPSGHVHSMRVGASVATGRAVDPGLHHVAAVRRGATVELHVDGVPAGSRTSPGGALDLGVLPPLRVGGGPRAAFAGDVLEPRLFGAALGVEAIGRLAVSRPVS